MAEQLISTDLLNALNCDQCDNSLTYFPIFSTKDENICGRCSVKDGAIRNNLYETLVACLRFSCRYKQQGCSRELLPKDIPEHEDNCSFRIIKCFLFGCDWNGVSTSLINHCEDQHSKLMVKENEEFYIDLNASDEVTEFLVYNNQLMVVSWEFYNDRKILECLITHHPEEFERKSYSYTLILKYGKNTYFTNTDTNNITQISYADLLGKHIGAPKIIGRLSLEKSYEERCQASREKDQKNLLALLKCSICFKYVLPPIFSRPNGIIYCKQCCAGIPSVLSNFTLNNLANLIAYPCKNYESGCKFVAFPSTMEKHQEVCPFNVVKCVLSTWSRNCLWEDYFKRMESHIYENHAFEYNGALLRFEISGKIGLSSNLIHFGSDFFELLYTFDDENLYWLVRKIQGLTGKFKYEIELMDLNESKDRLILRKSCSSFQEKLYYQNILSDENTSCIPKSQVASFKKIEEKDVFICFKIKIFIHS